jgi:hypothetical protein
MNRVLSSDCNRERTCGRLRALGIFAAAVFAATGCERSAEHLIPGQVTVYFESFDTGAAPSDITFSLTNGLHHPIYVRGERTLFRTIRMSRPNAAVSCTGPRDHSFVEMGIDFAFPHPKSIVVSPGDRVRVVVSVTSLDGYRGSRCQITLALNEDDSIGPVVFRP